MNKTVLLVPLFDHSLSSMMDVAKGLKQKGARIVIVDHWIMSEGLRESCLSEGFVIKKVAPFKPRHRRRSFVR